MLKLDEYFGVQYWRVFLSLLKQNTEVCGSGSQGHFSKEYRDVERRGSSLAKYDAAIGASGAD